MLYFAPWKRILVLVTCLAAVVFASPNFFYNQADTASRARADIEAGRYGAPGQPGLDDLEAEASLWPAWLPPNVVSLGLDLRGGAHLLVEVQIQEVVVERMEGLRAEARDALQQAGIRRAVARARDDHVLVRVNAASDLDAAEDALRNLIQPVGGGLGFALGAGGPNLAISAEDDRNLRITLTEAALADIADRTMAQSLEIMRRRVDES
ncbi:MAG: protein translocase subunit SecD, partial [Pseudomonadota bacterium]